MDNKTYCHIVQIVLYCEQFSNKQIYDFLSVIRPTITKNHDDNGNGYKDSKNKMNRH